MLRPPQHRGDAPILFVHEDDDAWDKTKINEQVRRLKKRAVDHPFVRYQAGATRFDLSAPDEGPDGESGVLAYLDMTRATVFALRRLTWREVYTLQPMIAGGNVLGAYGLACSWALERVDGPSAIKVERDSGGSLTDETLQALFDLNASLPRAIGAAAFAASLPLLEAEKKP